MADILYSHNRSGRKFGGPTDKELFGLLEAFIKSREKALQSVEFDDARLCGLAMSRLLHAISAYSSQPILPSDNLRGAMLQDAVKDLVRRILPNSGECE